MRRIAIISVAVLLVLALSIVLVYAQGLGRCWRAWGGFCFAQPNPNTTGPGQGAGFARSGLTCPYGFALPNPNAGGWWTTVNPVTPEQKAFVEKIAGLHERVRQVQLEIARLRAEKADEKNIAALENELLNLRNQIRETMYANRDLLAQSRQMGPGCGMRGARCGYCPGPCCDNCPYGYNCFGCYVGKGGARMGFGPFGPHR